MRATGYLPQRRTVRSGAAGSKCYNQTLRQRTRTGSRIVFAPDAALTQSPGRTSGIINAVAAGALLRYGVAGTASIVVLDSQDAGALLGIAGSIAAVCDR
jgi:hypothetical protein